MVKKSVGNSVSKRGAEDEGDDRDSSDVPEAFTHRLKRALQKQGRPKPFYKEASSSDEEDDHDHESEESEKESEEEKAVKARPCKKAKTAPPPSPLADNEIESFLDMRNSDTSAGIELYIKWRGKSHMHCSWLDEASILKAASSMDKIAGGHLRRKVDKFISQNIQLIGAGDEDEDLVNGVDPQWLLVDRIIAERGPPSSSQMHKSRELLVKWKGLGYERCTWEADSALADFQEDVDRFRSLRSISDSFNSSDDLQLKGQETGGGGGGGVSAPGQAPNGKGSEAVSQRGKGSRIFTSTPPWLKGTLHPYQLEGLNWIYHKWSNNTSVILGDEMGLGKTAQAISFISSVLHQAQSADEGAAKKLPFLVVAPLSTLNNWERELKTWAPQLNVVTLIGTAEAREMILKHELYLPSLSSSSSSSKQKIDRQDRLKVHVLLTSYEILSRERSNISKVTFESIVVDEAHRLKSKDSLLFQDLILIKSKHKLLLTGTPLQNNLKELFTLLNFLDPKSFNIEALEERFVTLEQQEHVDQIHQILAPHLLRRLKKDVLKGLPPKQEQIVRVELSPMQREWYKTLLAKHYPALTAAEAGSRSRSSLIPAAEVARGMSNLVMQLRKCCNHPYLFDGAEPHPTNDHDQAATLRSLISSSGKLELVDRMVTRLIKRGHRVLIFSQFTRVLDILEDWLHYRNIGYQRIDGAVAGASRQKRIDRFNHVAADKSSGAWGSSVFLLSTRAGGQGINLATADTVIIFDSDWNPHNDLQAQSRAHRLGQKRPVMVYRLVTRATVEERMMQQMKEKLILEHLVVRKMPGASASSSSSAAVGAYDKEEGEGEEGKKKKKKGSGKLDQKELDEILRFGAQELFKQDAADGQPSSGPEGDQSSDQEAKPKEDSSRIVWDDGLLEKLLDRSLLESLKPGGGDEEDEREDLLQAFKVADFEMKVVVPDESQQKFDKPQAKAAAAEPEGPFWGNLLRNHYEEIKATEDNATIATEASVGKRTKARMVNYSENAMFSALNGLEGMEEGEQSVEEEEEEGSSSDDGGAGEGESDRESSQDDGEGEVAEGQRKGPKANTEAAAAPAPAPGPGDKKVKRMVERRPPIMQGEGDSLTIMGFTKAERRTLLGFVVKRGVAPRSNRWLSLLANVFDPSTHGQRPVDYIGLFMKCMLENQRHLANFSNGIPRSAMLNMADGMPDLSVEQVLQSVGLHNRLLSVVSSNGDDLLSKEAVALAIANRVRLALSYGALEFAATKLWAPSHDALLLMAVHNLGFGVWRKILDDPESNLLLCVTEELGDQDRPEDWVLRRVEGLDKAFRLAEEHERAARQREAAVMALKTKLITQYNEVTACISRRTRETNLDYDRILSAYKTIFTDISSLN